MKLEKSHIEQLWGSLPEALALGDLSWGENPNTEATINFNQKTVGTLSTSLNEEDAKELAGYLAPILYMEEVAGLGSYALSLHQWLLEAKTIEPSVCDWIGIYFKANYFFKSETTDLYLGPYIGEYTDHQVIPLDRGLCGLALREEKVVNVQNVHEDTRHIACSLKTNSELIVPLVNQSGAMVAELDIDCNRLAAFTPEIEKKFRDFCETFKAPF